MKYYLTISEASKVLGVCKSTLLNWEKKGKIKPDRMPNSDYRLYDKKTLYNSLRKLKKTSPNWLTAVSAAKLLGTTPTTIRIWGKTKKIKSLKSPLINRYFYSKSDIEQLLTCSKGEIYNIGEAAKFLEIGPRQLRYLSKLNKIKCYRHPISNYRFYYKKDLEKAKEKSWT
jgi:DNA-binding transcriptional MerR regulator